ncbi:MAG: hypothetical protein FVQ84_08505 [Planctomycetes bacterium]|nr:hypothetical protein [Planctomycetota bacterium]
MTALDDKLVPAALALITKFGISANITTITGNTYDPTTSSTAVGTPVVNAVTITPLVPAANKFIDGDLVKVGDVESFIAGIGLGFTPIPGLLVEVGSDDWKIVRVDTLSSGDSVAAYQMFLRK